MNSVADNFIAGVTICAEASSGADVDRNGVAHSILNRMRDGRWSKTPALVATDRKQYSCWNDDELSRRNLQRVLALPDNHPELLAARTAWMWANQNSDLDPTHGATHYHNKNENPKPTWTVGARVTLTTDVFIFYAGVK